MSKKSFLLCFGLLLISLFTRASYVYAQSASPCSVSSINPNPINTDFKGQITINTTGACFTSGGYVAVLYPSSAGRPDGFYFWGASSSGANQLTINNVDLSGGFLQGGIGAGSFINWTTQYPGPWTTRVCKLDLNKVIDAKQCSGSAVITETRNLTINQTTSSSTSSPSSTSTASNLPTVDISQQTQCTYQAGDTAVIQNITNLLPHTNYRWWWDGDPTAKFAFNSSDLTQAPFIINSSETQSVGQRTFCIDIEGQAPGRGCHQNAIVLNFTAGPPNGNTACIAGAKGTAGGAQAQPVFQDPCDNDPKNDSCTSAKGTTCTPSEIFVFDANSPANPNDTGVQTALGCLPTNPTDLIATLLKFFLGAAGGIALLLMAFGALQMITSAGNAEAVKAGQGRFTSAVIGLLFIIFSIFLLKVIGVDILQIPGFGAI